MSGARPKVLVITGPTAVGKSSAAMHLAKRLGGEIVSADSVQVYKFLDIGSNKPSREELNLVQHHLIDIVDPLEEDYTAGQFFMDARNATDEILSRDRVPVVVGGTSMYLRWYVYGKPPTKEVPREVRDLVESEVASAGGNWTLALKILEDVDPVRASQLTRNDWYRLKRSLEIIRSGQGALSELPDVGGAPAVESPELSNYDFRCFFIAVPRHELARRVDFRCEVMLHRGGLIDEVTSLLLRKKIRLESPPARAIGYRQTIEYLIARARDAEERQDPEVAFRSFLEVRL